MYRRHPPGSAEGGGAATMGGSAVTPPALTALLLALLVRRGSRSLELLLDAAHVLRALEEFLEDPPLALAGGGAERRRLLVGHVEHDRLRGAERRFGRPRDGVRIDARRHVVVAGSESADLRPHVRGLRRREELHERLDRWGVAERDEQVAADLDRARVGARRDGGEDGRVEARAGLRLRGRRDRAADEVGLEHARAPP